MINLVALHQARKAQKLKTRRGSPDKDAATGTLGCGAHLNTTVVFLAVGNEHACVTEHGKVARWDSTSCCPRR
jgi:hypothetical protein